MFLACLQENAIWLAEKLFAFIEDTALIQLVNKLDEPCAVCITGEYFSDDGSFFFIDNGFLIFDAVAEIDAPAREVPFDSCFA